jgi:hypothetical protein
MTTLDLDALERLAAEATPGPWRVGDPDQPPFYEGGDTVQVGYRVLLRMNGHFQHEADARLIAAAREAVPLLVAEVRRLRASVDSWRRLATHAADALVGWGEAESCDEGDEARAIFAALDEETDQ